MARQIGKMLNTREPKIISGPGEVSYIVANWYSRPTCVTTRRSLDLVTKLRFPSLIKHLVPFFLFSIFPIFPFFHFSIFPFFHFPIFPFSSDWPSSLFKSKWGLPTSSDLTCDLVSEVLNKYVGESEANIRWEKSRDRDIVMCILGVVLCDLQNKNTKNTKVKRIN